jgi:hypothetical protein
MPTKHAFGDMEMREQKVRAKNANVRIRKAIGMHMVEEYETCD